MRIVTSEAFRNAPQLAAFLTFVVEKALAGEAQEIKGYTIATQALGRDESFDPQIDPIVRVEAGRLRRALDAYYANAGRDDRLKVRIPRGSYVPVFERAQEPVPEQPIPEEPVQEEPVQEPSSKAGAEPGPVPLPAIAPPAAAEPEPGGPSAASKILDPARFDPEVPGTPALAVSPEIPLALEPAVPELVPAAEMRPGLAGTPATPGRIRHKGLHVAAALAGLVLLAGLLAWVTGMAGSSGAQPSRDAAPGGAAVEGRPVVAVQPVELAGSPVGSFSPDLLRSTLLDALARFDEVAVLDAARPEDGKPGVERYALNLRIASGPSVMARLTHEATAKVVWARRFDAKAQLDPREPVETEIARQIAMSVGQPYGVLFADLIGRPGIPDRMRCTLKAYDYWNSPTPERHLEARGCLEAVVAQAPRAATAWANLAYFYLDEHRSGFNPRPDSLDRALKAARKGIAIAPESPRANQALMGVYFTRGDVEQALRQGERARDLNPFDADVLADLGARYVQVGRYREGAALIERAAEINPADPPWYDFFLFLAAHMQGDRVGARLAASRITSDDYVLGLVARAIVAGEEGDQARAKRVLARLVALQPEYGRDPRAALKRRWFAPEIYDRLVAGLAAAGLKG